MSGFRLVVGVLLTIFLSTAAFAQSARATGTVKDTNGRPIKGATVRAVNRDASPSQITSTTDDKGRWAMIGLRTGTWTVHVEAPGFTPVEATAPVRVAATPPMGFALARDPGPIPGALDKNVHPICDRGERAARSWSIRSGAHRLSADPRSESQADVSLRLSSPACTASRPRRKPIPRPGARFSIARSTPTRSC